jgi:26S proteasome regulatory subunit T3
MAEVAVENPANQVPPHKKQLPSSIPNIDTLEGLGTDGSDEYSTLKKLQRYLEYAPPLGCSQPYDCFSSYTN